MDTHKHDVPTESETPSSHEVEAYLTELHTAIASLKETDPALYLALVEELSGIIGNLNDIMHGEKEM
jgi:hypothetical protein